jgi:hypothetical protein
MISSTRPSAVILSCLLSIALTQGFLQPHLKACLSIQPDRLTFITSVALATEAVDQDEDEDEDEEDLDEDIDFLFEEPSIAYEDLEGAEKAWRYAKKPLLSIGSKGATLTHGNSLRNLLQDHTVVKVKVNTKKFGKCRFVYQSISTYAHEKRKPF